MVLICRPNIGIKFVVQAKQSTFLCPSPYVVTGNVTIIFFCLLWIFDQRNNEKCYWNETFLYGFDVGGFVSCCGCRFRCSVTLGSGKDSSGSRFRGEGPRVVVISEGMGFHPFSLHLSQLQ